MPSIVLSGFSPAPKTSQIAIFLSQPQVACNRHRVIWALGNITYWKTPSEPSRRQKIRRRTKSSPKGRYAARPTLPLERLFNTYKRTIPNKGLIRSIIELPLLSPAHITSSNSLDTPCISPGLLNGRHSGLANEWPHTVEDTTMTAPAAGNSSRDTTAPTNVTSSRVSQNTRREHRREHNSRLSK